MSKREEVLNKIAQGNLTIEDLMDPEASEIVRLYIEERHPGLLGSITTENLLSDPEIRRAIEESVQEELKRRKR